MCTFLRSSCLLWSTTCLRQSSQTFHCLLNLGCRHKLVSQPERTSPTVIMYPASSGFSGPDGTLLWKEINHCEKTLASLIKPTSFAMDEWINFEPVKPVPKKKSRLAHWFTLINAALAGTCCEFALFQSLPRFFLPTSSKIGETNWSWIPRDHIQVQKEK